MKLYRIETCVSLVNDSVKIPAGYGPYGTRSSLRVMRVRLDCEDQDVQEIELRDYVKSNNLFNFHHLECTPDKHPSPYNDYELMQSLQMKNDVIREHEFAFDSIEKLKNWFNEAARNRLHNSGYYVSIYEVESAHVGTTQCVFKKSEATLVDFISCVEV